MLLDIYYIVKQFFEALPTDYNDFKQLVHKMFPKYVFHDKFRMLINLRYFSIIDTKFMCTSQNFKELINSTVLQHVYQTIKEPPFEETIIEWKNPEFCYSLVNQKEHEAGFDAFLTGYCLIGLLKYLKVPLVDNFNPQKCQQIRQFVNRIYVQGIQQNPYIFLTGREREYILFSFLETNNFIECL